MREIRMTVYAGLLKKNSNLGGAQGEGDVTDLLIEFKPEWDGTTKTVTFYDANMENPVQVTLTTALLEDAAQDIRTYRVPIPSEPLAIAGQMTFTIDGYVNGSRARTAQDTLIVLPSPMVKDPSAITPTQAEQLQAGIDAVLEDIAGMETAIANEAGREQAEAARRTAESARVTAEQGRAAAEQSRASAEDTRESQEAARQNAEAERQAAEQERVNTDTGIVAQATQQANAAAESAIQASASAQTAAQQATLAQQAAGNAAAVTASQLTGQMAGYVSDAQEAAQDAADAAEAVSAYGTEVQVTITAAGWTGSAAPYTQTVAVAGLLANSYGDIGPSNSATAAQRAAYRAALIAVSAQADGSLTLVADGDKPAVDLPAVVRFGGLLASGGGGGESYTLPAATASTLGGVKVGSGLSVEADGTLSAAGGGITVDSDLSGFSENPVQNKTVYYALLAKASIDHNHSYSSLTDKPTIPTVPTSLPNPYKLTFTGAVTGEYDGSAAKTINIPEGGGGTEQLVVTFTSTGSGGISADKSYAEVAAAINAGTPVLGKCGPQYYPVVQVVSSGDVNTILFEYTNGSYVESFTLSQDNSVFPYSEEFGALPPVTASDNGKLLQVVDGAWAAVTIENAAGGSY
ncbi:hypothetical protein NE579_01035 [Intestinimonas massiliensis]|uniref:BppU N-terminal domain-containing protein n=1 Tax=Intestinimonas massiliensis (ex Afouda et al. 2020) TaxID=1673721 RepID=A0AAW5JPC9_9FIRM|nr:hypothetical protein [Intestinimonas massiliensis (ex Afouda et al. 2020)]MCQ4768995.1 hypothetical protein [Intestinimonas massiliensis (ex Afouda et al. 2020)]MCQ4769048.1 hypothetical protein [Intestinimonas massiliensis (ex Afouda et al. 2020)]